MAGISGADLASRKYEVSYVINIEGVEAVTKNVADIKKDVSSLGKAFEKVTSQVKDVQKAFNEMSFTVPKGVLESIESIGATFATATSNADAFAASLATINADLSTIAINATKAGDALNSIKAFAANKTKSANAPIAVSASAPSGKKSATAEVAPVTSAPVAAAVKDVIASVPKITATASLSINTTAAEAAMSTFQNRVASVMAACREFISVPLKFSVQTEEAIASLNSLESALDRVSAAKARAAGNINVAIPEEKTTGAAIVTNAAATEPAKKAAVAAGMKKTEAVAPNIAATATFSINTTAAEMTLAEFENRITAAMMACMNIVETPLTFTVQTGGAITSLKKLEQALARVTSAANVAAASVNGVGTAAVPAVMSGMFSAPMSTAPEPTSWVPIAQPTTSATPVPTVPTPTVTVPTPTVTVPTPTVTVPTPSVTVPTPSVTVPTPSVTVSTPTVSKSPVPTPTVSTPSVPKLPVPKLPVPLSAVFKLPVPTLPVPATPASTLPVPATPASTLPVPISSISKTVNSSMAAAKAATSAASAASSAASSAALMTTEIVTAAATEAAAETKGWLEARSFMEWSRFAASQTETDSDKPSSPTKKKKIRLYQEGAPLHYPSAMGYKMLGPTALDFGFNNITAFLRSMGIMYGVMGVGGLISSAMQSATEYNNIMQTTRNILETHDQEPGFGARFSEMEHTVRDVGTATRFTAPEVADASRFLAMAGFNIEDINRAIRPIADIALVGDTELGRTADVVTNIMTGYGIQADEVRHAADIMTMTFTKSNVTLLEIAESFKYAASLLSNAGVSFEEATAAIGVLGNAGIKGSQAGTTMRTILSNIVNPTLKQQAAWEQLGIERFDENGRVRKLSDIFGDLNKANLQVADFYRMFHRTAAQGAVALTANVETWNDIIRENFLSEGLVAELAQAKQNTIQGLWAQITSTFTEQGMRAFEDVEPKIRGILGEALDWLKSEDTGKTIKDITNDLFSLYDAFKQNVSYLYKFYMTAKPAILIWVKWQLAIAPLITSLRALRSVWLLFMKGVRVSNSIVKFSNNLHVLRTELGWSMLNTKKLTNELVLLDAAMKRTTDNDTLKALVARGQIVEGALARMKWIKKMATTVLNGVAGMAAGVAGGFFGGTIGEAINKEKGGFWGGLLGVGITGAMFAFSRTAGLVTTGVLALAAGIAALVKNAKEAKEAHEELAKSMSKTYFNENGEAYNGAFKYLAMVEDKNKSINQLLVDQIKKRRELLALERGEYEENTPGENTFLSKIYNDTKPIPYIDIGIAPSEILSRIGFDEYNDELQKAYSLAVKEATFYPRLGNEGLGQLFAMGLGYGKYAADDIIKQAEAYISAYNSSEDKDIERLRKNIARLREQYILPEVGDYFQDVEASRQQYGYLHNLPKYAKTGDWSELDNSYFFQYAKALTVRDAVDEKISSLQKAIDAFINGNDTVMSWLEFQSLGKQNRTVDLIMGILESGKVPSVTKQNGVIKMTSLDKNGNQSEITIDGSGASDILDEIKAMREILAGSGYWDSEQVNSIKSLMDEWIKSLKAVSDKTDSQLALIQSWTAPAFFQSSPTPLLPGEIADLNDMAEATDNQAKTHSVYDSRDYDYRSRYTSNAAVPKQVIVKIENLMNVESIDLSNPDNVAVINNFKGQLAQALIDVVHDFDVTYQ